MKQALFWQFIATAFLTVVASRADPPATATSATAAPGRRTRIVARQRIVMFPDVRDETTGIAAEHAWVKKKFPAYEWTSLQILEDKQGRVYHRVLLVSQRGGEVTIYFDVTNWFDRL